MNSKYIKLLIYAIALISLIHCFGVTKSFPEKKYFLIEVDNLSSDKTPPKNSVIKIRRLSISQKFEGKEFVYRKDNVSFESDFYNSFFISPSANIREELLKGMTVLKIFEWDSSLNTRLDPTHYLEVTIQQLYGDFRESPKAILDLDFFLYTENAGNTNVLLKKTYKKSITIQTKEAGDLALGWNQALTQILLELESDLKGKISVK